MEWDRFSHALALRNWNQDRLARMLGIQPNKVSKWKSDDDLWVSELLDIARTLDVSPGWLLGEPRIEDVVNDQDRLILAIVHDLGYPEAARRLARPLPSTSHTSGIDPATGAPVPQKPKKRKGAG